MAGANGENPAELVDRDFAEVKGARSEEAGVLANEDRSNGSKVEAILSRKVKCKNLLKDSSCQVDIFLW